MAASFDTPLVLLAGGKSSRMGVPKGLMRISPNDPFWIEQQLGRFKAAGGKNVVVVLGYDQEKYLEAMPTLNPIMAINPLPEFGPFSSIQCGLRRFASAESAFVCPVDVPIAGSEVLQALLRARDGSDADLRVCLPTYDGRGGHPVLLSRKFIGTLLEVSPDSEGARLDVQIRRCSPETVIRVPVADSDVLKNINFPHDLK